MINFTQSPNIPVVHRRPSGAMKALPAPTAVLYGKRNTIHPALEGLAFMTEWELTHAFEDVLEPEDDHIPSRNVKILSAELSSSDNVVLEVQVLVPQTSVGLAKGKEGVRLQQVRTTAEANLTELCGKNLFGKVVVRINVRGA